MQRNTYGEQQSSSSMLYILYDPRMSDTKASNNTARHFPGIGSTEAEVSSAPFRTAMALVATAFQIGGNRPHTSDFRLVASTNRDLEEEVRAGRFRENLYYRLNVLSLRLPPLRERIEDIPVLARHFLARFAKKYNRPHLRLSPKDDERLMGYH